MRMNDLTVVDSIYLDAQQKEDVRRLSSLGYSYGHENEAYNNMKNV